MKALAVTFARGVLLVGLVALNTRWIAGSRMPEAFVTASALSWVWWQNSRTAARSDVRGARVVYAIGAGVGTALSIWIGALR